VKKTWLSNCNNKITVFFIVSTRFFSWQLQNGYLYFLSATCYYFRLHNNNNELAYTGTKEYILSEEGYNQTSFRPDDNISRTFDVQLIVLLSLYTCTLFIWSFSTAFKIQLSVINGVDFEKVLHHSFRKWAERWTEKGRPKTELGRKVTKPFKTTLESSAFKGIYIVPVLENQSKPSK